MSQPRGRVLRHLPAVCALALMLAAAPATGQAENADPTPPTAEEVAALCALADRLTAGGFLDDARMTYEEALTAQVDASCAAAGLQHLAVRYRDLGNALKAAGNEEEANESFQKALEIDPRLRVADAPPAELMAVWYRIAAALHVTAMVGALALLIALLLMVARRYIAKPTLEIGTFETEAEPKIGGGFTSLLRAGLLDLAEGTTSSSLLTVQGEVTGVDVPAKIQPLLPATVSWLEPALQLLGKLLRRRKLTVSGILHPAGDDGPGITLKLTGSGAVLAGQSLWLGHFEARPRPPRDASAGDYYQLADYASIWLLFALREHVGRNRLELLGTGDWRSYALFRAGTRAQRARRPSDASALYCRALERDPSLRGARVNLARNLILEPAGGAGTQGERLVSAIGLLERTLCDARDAIRDPSVYTARYLKVMAHNELGQTAEELTEARELVGLIERAKEETRRRSSLISGLGLFGGREEHVPRGDRDKLFVYLESIEEPALIMLATLEAVTEAAPGKGRGLDRLAKVDRFSPRPLTQYNLACAYSLLAQRSEEEMRHDRESISLGHLGRALALKPAYASHAARDKMLAFVRESDGTGNRFAHLVAVPTPAGAVPVGGLAAIALIGPTRAAALAEHGVRSVGDLIEKAATPAECSKVAAGLDIPGSLVRRWAGLAGLTRVAGVGIPEVNLLHLSGVESVPGLACSAPASLAAMIEAFAPLLDVEPLLPQRWNCGCGRPKSSWRPDLANLRSLDSLGCLVAPHLTLR